MDEIEAVNYYTQKEWQIADIAQVTGLDRDRVDFIQNHTEEQVHLRDEVQELLRLEENESDTRTD